MNDRIEYPGISHGDIVMLTGEEWGVCAFRTDLSYKVDDKTFHRPVIYDETGMHWYIMEKDVNTDFSVTKVES